MNPLDRPVFVLGAHKSGTSLVRSLLDGHPELLVLPKETHFFQAAGCWVDYGMRRTVPRRRSVTSMRADLAGAAEVESRRSEMNPYGDAADFDGYDMNVFRTVISRLSSTDLAHAHPIFIEALVAALPGHSEIGPRRIVEKSVENTEFAPFLQRIHPGADFLYVVRNPYANFVSLRRYESATGSGRYPDVHRVAATLYNSYFHLDRAKLLLDRLHVVRYEDLVGEPAATMRDVASFLDIEYTEGLEEPTLQGRPWRGNSTLDRAFVGVSEAALRAWRNEITPFEVDLVNRIAQPVMKVHHYMRFPDPRRSDRMVPNPGENPRTWLRNRAVRWNYWSPASYPWARTPE